MGGRKPTLDYFRVFGSKCFILKTKDYLTKFDQKLYECVFLGYSQNSKAYNILNKHTRKIEESLNVTFDETPPPSKTSPLVDDDLDEEEEIKVAKKKILEKDIEDETLEIDEVVNIKESRNHLLENVKENLNQRTLRLFAQGYNQQEGINYEETYAPVARLECIKILLAFACTLDFKLFKMDVKSAFLNGFINEEVYVAQPPGFIDFEKPDHVYKLKKDLYGLKQAPKAFGGNVESKKMQKNILKHQFENFSTAANESLDKVYGIRLQKLLSQLGSIGAPISKEDINQKFLRSLPSSWNQIALIMRNKPDIDEIDIHDLHNNLRVLLLHGGINQVPSTTCAHDIALSFLVALLTVKKKGILLENVDLDGVMEEVLMVGTIGRSKATKQMNLITGTGGSRWPSINTARPVSTVRPSISTARPSVSIARPSVSTTRPVYATRPTYPRGNPEILLQDHAVVDSGCSSHMTGNKAYLSDYEDFNGGFMAFGSDPKGGKITGKGKIKTANLDFDDVYFVDKLNFKLLDESQVVLRAPRKDDVTEFKNYAMNEFYAKKGIKREFSVARTLQQNGVAERKNRTLIEVAKTMLADSLLPIPFWAEAVNTACYYQPNVTGTGPNWMFDLDFLTNSMNYVPISVENYVNVDERTRIPVKDVVQDAQEKPSENASSDKDVQDSEDAADKEEQH
ncbi:retrovirus-related pol polyprotein from transposon TNT 1-94 [Tanacetum coccineum]